MPRCAGVFGQFADVGIRAPEQNGLLQQALVWHFGSGQIRELVCSDERAEHDHRQHGKSLQTDRDV